MNHREIFYRLGVFWTVVVLTAVSILLSLGGTALILYLTGAGGGWGIGLTLAVVLPLIIAPLMSSFLLKLMMQLDQAQKEKAQLVEELQEMLDNVKTLKGLIPICASCKKIRDDAGYWHHLETYLRTHSEARLSHGYCPDCAEALRLEIDAMKQGSSNRMGG